MKKKNLHYLIIYSVVMLFLLFVRANKWDYEDYYAWYNFLITFYILFHVGYIIFNYRDFVMTTQRLRSDYIERNLRYKCTSVENGKIDRIFVNDYIDDFWYELDYMLTINRDCSVKEYNDFIMSNPTSKELYKTMITKRSNNKSIMKDYMFNKTTYNTTRYMMLFILVLTMFLTICIMIKKGFLY